MNKIGEIFLEKIHSKIIKHVNRKTLITKNYFRNIYKLYNLYQTVKKKRESNLKISNQKIRLNFIITT